MDSSTLKDYPLPAKTDAKRPWQGGEAWLAGGTWLFSEPQPEIGDLMDLSGFDWPVLAASPEGLEISATCTASDLNEFIAPHEWTAASLLKECCNSLIVSHATWNPIAGNDRTPMPTGALISLASALDGICSLWPRHGSPREVAIADFIAGNYQDSLASGELLRSIWIPAASLRKHYTLRRFSLTPGGRSSVLLVGTLCPISSAITLTITGATSKPVQLVFPDSPSAKAIHMAINENVPFDHFLDDPHSSPLHRRHLTYHYAEKILQELAMI